MSMNKQGPSDEIIKSARAKLKAELESSQMAIVLNGYLPTIQRMLASLPTNLGKLAAYDTGSGLSICRFMDDLELVDTLSVVQARHMRLPLSISEGDQWDVPGKQARDVSMNS